MPPFGLYPVPKHHVHAQSASGPRPIFNSLDFDEETVPAATSNGIPSQSVDDGNNDELDIYTAKQARKDKKAKAKEEKKRRESSRAHVIQEEDEESRTAITASSDGKIKKGPGRPKGSTSKRKRENEASENAPATTPNPSCTASFGLQANFLEDLKASMGNPGAVFDQPSRPAHHVMGPSRKKSRLNMKSEMDNNSSKTSGQSHTSDMTNTPKSKKSKSYDDMNSSALNTLSAALDPLPKSPYTSIPKQTPVPIQSDAREHRSTFPSNTATVSRQTPIPLPRNMHPDHSSTFDGSQRTPEKFRQPDSQVLVADTPPSMASNRVAAMTEPPIPFKIPQLTLAKMSGSTKPKKGRLAVPLSSPISESDESPAPRPVASPTNHRLAIKPSGQISLTKSNLKQYTEPLNDSPRPKFRAASVAVSTTSSTSSMNIKQYFTRTPKPNSQPRAENSPFIVSEGKKNRGKKHKEAGAEVLTKKFDATRKTIDFTVEQRYLASYLSWRIQNDAKGPLPCLGQATGCNAKREIVLRLNKEDTSNELQVFVATDGGDHGALEVSKQHNADAETLLRLAVTARIPVPIGRVEGVYTLFCPAYSDTHVDKYGFGQRTLTIAAVADSPDSNLYTARFNILPYPQLYDIISFSAPPHASFRATIVTTQDGKYNMEIVFLGNGYLQLRVDLYLLLKGKSAETKDGRPVYMEFIGVHEQAVSWKCGKDEVLIGRKD